MATKVQIHYDAQVDVLRIRLGESAIEESDEVEPGVIADYDVAGNIIGLEILDASELVQHPKTAAVQTEE